MRATSLLLLAVLAAADAAPPAWAELERGQDLFSQRRYHEALSIFLDLRDQLSPYPEVEYWIGRVYQNDRNLELAVKQYQQAISLKDQLYNDADIYPIYYHLADAYRRSARPHLYEQTLLEISLEEQYPDQRALEREAQLVERLKTDGLDLMLYSQPLTLQYSEDALRLLGLFYYEQGFYSSAVNMLAYPTLSFFNKTLARIQMDQPDFAFPLNPAQDLMRSAPFQLFRRLSQDLRHLRLEPALSYDEQGLQQGLEAIRKVDQHYRLTAFGFFLDYLNRSEQGRSYAQGKRIYQTLYYLAAALWGSGYDESARKIWRVLSYREQSPVWQSKATAQLLQPFVDPDPLP